MDILDDELGAGHICTHLKGLIGKEHVNPFCLLSQLQKEACVQCLSTLASYVDELNCIPVNYMHALLEGVVRMLTKCWCNSYRLIHWLLVENNYAQLMKQSPTMEFPHSPLSISKHFNYWKASELRY